MNGYELSHGDVTLVIDALLAWREHLKLEAAVEEDGGFADFMRQKAASAQRLADELVAHRRDDLGRELGW